MAFSTALRLNMTGLCPDPAAESERYRAALDMAAFVDRHDFTVVSVEEHHCAENGWLPSPLTLASMIVGRTEKARVNVTALLITLYDPVRLAEDIAILDLASGGRFSFVAGMGYRPVEYQAMGRDFAQRGRLMDEAIDTLLKAWTGEPFEYRGNTIRVTPVPVSKPHPFFFVGGMSKAAARRAAKHGLPFYPPMHMPELEAFYYAELERNGKQGFVYHPGEGNSMIFLEEDPDRGWRELAPYFLRETQEYSRWKAADVARPNEQPVETLEDLRAQKRYEILTPDECIERARSTGDGFTLVLHPLAGGIPIDRAWRNLELCVDKVLPALR